MSETIVGISTALGDGGINIIRISGENAEEILDNVFKPVSTEKEKLPRVFRYGFIYDKEILLDEVLAVFFKAPYTYTREDVVEIHCHGGTVPTGRIFDLVCRNGARPAHAGEFTKRAYLNGRIDLSQAEAVIDLIRAKTDEAGSLALNQMRGKLSEEIESLRHQLLLLLSRIAVNLDYSEEDIVDIENDELRNELTDVKIKIQELLEQSKTGKIIREGLKVAIAGRPNVGKSSLLNELLGEERAIVTDIPGTTRDSIEENLHLSGLNICLTDTAGIRKSSDIVEQIGVERSQKAFSEAEIILLVLDQSEELKKEDYELLEQFENRETIILLNKTDKEKAFDKNNIKTDKMLISCSMKTGEGLTELLKKLKEYVYFRDAEKDVLPLVSNERHIFLLSQANGFLEEALSELDNEMPIDLIEPEIRKTWMSLGEITGETVTEDIIDQVFKDFCLGK